MNFSHIPKFGILGCDKATPLKRNLILEIQMDQKEIWNSAKSLRMMIEFILRVDEECANHHSRGALN
jgi:hypothetical protein